MRAMLLSVANYTAEQDVEKASMLRHMATKTHSGMLLGMYEEIEMEMGKCGVTHIEQAG